MVNRMSNKMCMSTAPSSSRTVVSTRKGARRESLTLSKKSMSLFEEEYEDYKHGNDNDSHTTDTTSSESFVTDFDATTAQGATANTTTNNSNTNNDTIIAQKDVNYVEINCSGLTSICGCLDMNSMIDNNEITNNKTITKQQQQQLDFEQEEEKGVWSKVEETFIYLLGRAPPVKYIQCSGDNQSVDDSELSLPIALKDMEDDAALRNPHLFQQMLQNQQAQTAEQDLQQLQLQQRYELRQQQSLHTRSSFAESITRSVRSRVSKNRTPILKKSLTLPSSKSTHTLVTVSSACLGGEDGVGDEHYHYLGLRKNYSMNCDGVAAGRRSVGGVSVNGTSGTASAIRKKRAGMFHKFKGNKTQGLAEC